MYHRINDLLPASDLITPAARFEEHMKFLAENKKRFNVLSLKSWTEDPRLKPQDESGPDRASCVDLAITIDDGYRDNYLNAFPVLKKYNLPASVFLTTGLIATDNAFKRYEGNPLPDMLNWDEIAEMARHGITFGPHSYSHPHLPALRPDDQERELQDSLKMINKMVPERARLNIFCYPYGEYDQNTLDILRELAVAFALTVKPGVNTSDTLPLELHRTMVSGLDDIKNFENRILADYD